MSNIPPYLASWIQWKVDSYQEKPRKGTPRGQPYGISKPKYHAVLLHLAYTRAFDLRAIAREADVSHSLLLNWRTEEKFRDLVDRAVREYSAYLVNSLTKKWFDVPGSRLFSTAEASRYSVLLLDRISRDLSLVFKRHVRELSENPRPIDVRRMRKVNELCVAFAEAQISGWGNKQAKIALWEQRAHVRSGIVKVQRAIIVQALKRGDMETARKAVDTICRVATFMILVVKDLGTELVREGLDETITERISQKLGKELRGEIPQISRE